MFDPHNWQAHSQLKCPSSKEPNPRNAPQLLFNLAMPSSVLNRATRVTPPAPIVIEKLVPRRERQDDGESCNSSLCLSVLSEERLQAAVKLAKRDLRRKRQESMNSLSHISLERSPSPDNHNNKASQHVLKEPPPPEGKHRTSSPKRPAKSGSQVLVYTPQKLSVTTKLDQGQSPPTRDPGMKANSREPQLGREIRKLQNKLATYIQRIEQLANRGRLVECVEPDEKRRMEIRRQEQAARSARIIYVLQQQVKEIQEDIDKLRSQSARHTKKSRAVDRLAAAHRGAVRAMQVFMNQLSDPAESRVPAQCKQLGQLIRQLSLCSAKVEVGLGSAVPETTLDILEKLETLDLALNKQTVEERDSRIRSASPARERSPTRAHSVSPPRAPPPLPAKAPRGLKKLAPTKKTLAGRKVARRPHRAIRFLEQERSEVLKTGIQSVIHQRQLRELENVGFQQPTVSSRLRESQLPQRETSVPWIPTSPHSITKQRAVSSRPEPRCLFSPAKNSSQPSLQSQGQGQGKSSTQQGVTGENQRQVQTEALRKGWLDRITEDRLRELNPLSKEETECIKRLRSEVESQTQWAERSEQAARERLQPLPDCVQGGELQKKKVSSLRQQLSEQEADKAQTTVNADLLTEAILENLLRDTAAAVSTVVREHGSEVQPHTLLQEPTLEMMLQRMEEMEKDQEEVRRRFAMISYSDPLLWEKDTRTQRNCESSRPTTPQPIRLTKPAQRPSNTGDIILLKPLETSVVSESSIVDEGTSAPIPSHPFPSRVENKGGVRLSVPSSMLKNIQKYREAHDSYLHLVSHEAVGSFNPWAIADSLAEELLDEALADVAAEFQNVCEEYAEAIFTSEFLQPVQSPSLSVS
ncbi:protein moonraker isoform X2 [Hoplias malabaricus]|uniref:protein moonraker isoform X2 n=1 Tax=Hoplias malabaricus TaxID=27720 RepID=UPI0034625F3F